MPSGAHKSRHLGSQMSSLLHVADGGFLAINEYLQSAGGPTNIFAAGDVATSICDPRPKAGVFAVRQGAPLADNIRLFLTGQKLKPFKPQKDFLGLVSTGDCGAVATRGSMAFSGEWLWKWKDQIDRRFMKQFSEELPSMGVDVGPTPDVLQGETSGLLDVWERSKMLCRGCAAKVAPLALHQVLQELNLKQPDDTVSSLVGVPLAQEDAAVLPPPPSGMVSVHTVDVLSAIVADPYVFGRIAAVHALSDCFAMGAKPATALAIAQVCRAHHNSARPHVCHVCTPHPDASHVNVCGMRIESHASAVNSVESLHLIAAPRWIMDILCERLSGMAIALPSSKACFAIWLSG
eukprot:jgi/Ulvmu1/7255/UM035_0042.1